MTPETVKCRICGRAYKVYSMYAGNQSVCPGCREAAERAYKSPDSADQLRRRDDYWFGPPKR